MMLLAIWMAVPVDGAVQGPWRALLETRPNRVVLAHQGGTTRTFPLPNGRPSHIAFAQDGTLWVFDAARRVLERWDLQGNRLVSRSLPEGLGVIREMVPYAGGTALMDAAGNLVLVEGNAVEQMTLPGLTIPRDLLAVGSEWWVLDRTSSGFLGMKMRLVRFDLHGRFLNAVDLPSGVVVGVDMQHNPADSTLLILDAARPVVVTVHAYQGTLLAEDSLGVGGNVALLPAWRGTPWVVSLGAPEGVLPLDSLSVIRQEYLPVREGAFRYTVRRGVLEFQAPSGRVQVLDVLGRTVVRRTVGVPASFRVRLVPGHYWLLWEPGDGTARKFRVVIP